MKKKAKSVYKRINGVSFEEYVSACAHLAQGFSESQIIDALDIDELVWHDTLNKWNIKFCKLLTSDSKVATLYRQVFSNPRIGRFACSLYKDCEKEQLLLIVPDFDTFRKILWHTMVGQQCGEDHIAILKTYGLDIVKWGILYKHYMGHALSIGKDITDEADRWKEYWETVYRRGKHDNKRILKKNKKRTLEQEKLT